MKKIGFIFAFICFALSVFGQAQLEIPYSIKVLNPKPLDAYYYNTSFAPYTSTSEVTSQVSSSVRYIGQTFNVNGTEYWFTGGILDGNLAVKSSTNFWGLSGTSTFTAPVTIAGSSTNTLKFNFNSLGTTQTNGVGIWLQNSTAAALGAQQVSPSIVLEGQGWKTASTATSQSVKFAQYVTPLQGLSSPSGNWGLYYSINGGAYVNAFTVGSTPSSPTFFNIAGNINTTSKLNFNSGTTSIYDGNISTTGIQDLSISSGSNNLNLNGGTETGGILLGNPATQIAFQSSITTSNVGGLSFALNDGIDYYDIIDLTAGITSVWGTLGTGILQSEQSSGTTIFTDGTGSPKGIQYLTPEVYVTQPGSLVDKQFAENHFWRASNGVTLTGTNTIAQTTNNVAFTSTTGSLTFNSSAGGGFRVTAVNGVSSITDNGSNGFISFDASVGSGQIQMFGKNSAFKLGNGTTTGGGSLQFSADFTIEDQRALGSGRAGLKYITDPTGGSGVTSLSIMPKAYNDAFLRGVSMPSLSAGFLKYTGSAWTFDNSTYITGPAGSNTQIQFNNSGAFGASSKFVWDGSQFNVNDGTIPNLSVGTAPGGFIVLQGPTGNVSNQNGGDILMYGGTPYTGAQAGRIVMTGREIDVGDFRNLYAELTDCPNGTTTLITYASTTNTNFQIETRLVCHFKAGTGSAGDGVMVTEIESYKNVGGTVTQIGSSTNVANHSLGATAPALILGSISGANVRTQVLNSTASTTYSCKAQISVLVTDGGAAQ